MVEEVKNQDENIVGTENRMELGAGVVPLTKIPAVAEEILHLFGTSTYCYMLCRARITLAISMWARLMHATTQSLSCFVFACPRPFSSSTLLDPSPPFRA